MKKIATKSSHLSLLCFLAGPAAASAPAIRASSATIDPAHLVQQVKDLGTLFNATREIISERQAIINDASRGDKGLSPEFVLAESIRLFKEKTHREPQGAYEITMMRAIIQVMTSAQSLINEKGVGFKGFIPATYGRNLTETFNALMPGQARIKASAPAELVRNLQNMPDEWERLIIQRKFQAAAWPRDQAYHELQEENGRRIFRFIAPQYYKSSCLECHGKPAGSFDITGSRREGASEGDLGGALSVILYLDQAGG